MKVMVELDGGIPECCHDCRLASTLELDEDMIRTWKCRAVEEPDGSYVFRDLSEVDKPKPDWCPLRPLPERKDNADVVGFTLGEPITEELADKLIDFGFNECLNAITGEGEE